MTATSTLCFLCRTRPAMAPSMCGPCGKAFDRHVAKDGTTLELMRWAASRAWASANAASKAGDMRPKAGRRGKVLTGEHGHWCMASAKGA